MTRSVCLDVAVAMVLFGLTIGLAFPFFVMLLGVSRETALTPTTFAACLSAGIPPILLIADLAFELGVLMADHLPGVAEALPA